MPVMRELQEELLLGSLGNTPFLPGSRLLYWLVTRIWVIPPRLLRGFPMYVRDGKLVFSPSDLTNFLESRFISFMDRLLGENDARAVKDPADEALEIIRERGMEHERKYLENLKSSGKDVVEIQANAENGLALTRQAMKDGRRYIYQAHLAQNQFYGKCDFLVRVDDRPSAILERPFSYEPYDTKLSLKPKPDFAIQLCCYAEMLAEAQGNLPESFIVVLGDGTSRSFRTEDFFYFYQQLKRQFIQFHESFDTSKFPDT